MVTSDPHASLSAEDLIDWLDDRLDPDRRRAVQAKIEAAGPDTDRALAWLRTFRADASTLPLVSPPPLVSQRLRGLLRGVTDTPSPRRDVVAHPVLDTRLLVRPAGVRGSATPASARYQLTFAGPDLTVVLDVSSDGPGAVTLRGQVIPKVDTPAVFEAHTEGPSGGVRTILGDDLGGFRLDGVPTDARTLVVSNDLLTVSMALHLSRAGDE